MQAWSGTTGDGWGPRGKNTEKDGGLRNLLPCPGSPTPFFMARGRGSRKGLKGLQGQEQRGEGLELESMRLEWCKLEGRGQGDGKVLAL